MSKESQNLTSTSLPVQTYEDVDSDTSEDSAIGGGFTTSSVERRSKENGEGDSSRSELSSQSSDKKTTPELQSTFKSGNLSISEDMPSTADSKKVSNHSEKEENSNSKSETSSNTSGVSTGDKSVGEGKDDEETEEENKSISDQDLEITSSQESPNETQEEDNLDHNLQNQHSSEEEQDEEEGEEDEEEESEESSSDDDGDVINISRFQGRGFQPVTANASRFANNSVRFGDEPRGGSGVTVSYNLRHKMDFDEMLSACSKCKYLPEADMRRLCEYVMDILIEEPNVVSLQSPVTICGDVHGQFFDLLELFRTAGELPHTNYVFMGDFVDRGHYSLETFTYLLVLKARYPDKLTLLRGNHETRQITQVYGFYEECMSKYGNANIWRECSRVFDLLSISALIDNTVFCVHGGLSPDIRTIDQIRTIDRQQEVPHQGAFCDLVWSDPDDVESWQTSPRGAGYLFGQNQTDEFVDTNGLECIARAHQLVLEGIRHQFDDKLVTVWSAPNYCYRCGNVAAVYEVNPDGSRSAKLFQAVPDNQRETPSKTITPYFL